MKEDRPSSTSLLIARALVLAAATPRLRALIVGDSAALTSRFLREAPAHWFDLALRFPFLRGVLFFIEHLCLPGVWLHWLVRKCLIDALARAALDSGCRQVVVLGAGLDTLTSRLMPECSCFELDHPATQTVKRRALTDAPVLIPADLRHASVPDLLRACPRFDARSPTLFVAEGLLMYLPPQRVEAIFRELAAASAPGTRFIFTFMEAIPGRRIAFQNERRVIGWWLDWRGESFSWALARGAVEDFAARHGWKFCSLSTADEMRRHYLAPAGLAEVTLAEGESVAVFSLPSP